MNIEVFLLENDVIENINSIDDEINSKLKSMLFKKSESYKSNEIDFISFRKIVKLFDEIFLKLRYSN